MAGSDPVFVYDDTFDVLPGIHLLFTPGHTPGSQSIVVDTEEGRVIVCGLCCDEGNFNPSDEFKEFWPDVLVPGLHVNSEEAYESLRRIKREADYIVTMHDQKTFERGVCPNPSWPRYLSLNIK
jgi:glyoxylase-like metal-dependent hydrolase (beta-lactamase superfamily II)